jgi:hypothetical protein
MDASVVICPKFYSIDDQEHVLMRLLQFPAEQRDWLTRPTDHETPFLLTPGSPKATRSDTFDHRPLPTLSQRASVPDVPLVVLGEQVRLYRPGEPAVLAAYLGRSGVAVRRPLA